MPTLPPLVIAIADAPPPDCKSSLVEAAERKTKSPVAADEL
jgi:hypothetical protein